MKVSPFFLGWARRGPSGTIETNRPAGYYIADAIAKDMQASGGKQGGVALDALLQLRGVQVIQFSDWKKLKSQKSCAREVAPREKFVRIADMIAVYSKFSRPGF